MPLVLGFLAALGALVFGGSARAQGGQGGVLVLVRATMPFPGPVVVGTVASLLAVVQDAFAPGGFAPPLAFRVRVVGLPEGGRPNYTGVFLTDVLGARAGEFLEFSPDKIQNVST